MRPFSLALILFVLSGCATFHSEDLGQEGLIYYLPRTLINVEITPYGVKRYVLASSGDKGDGEIVPAGDGTKHLLAETGDANITHIKLAITTETVADLRRPYVLSYKRNPLSTDHVCAATTKGILSSVEASTADETANIIISIAHLAGSLGVTPFNAPAPKDLEYLKAEAIESRKLSVQIDPLDSDDRRKINTLINTHFADVPGHPFNLAFPGADYFNARSELAACPVDSICYRSFAPMRYEFRGSTNQAPVQVDTVDVANHAFTGHVNVSRAFMVEKVTRLQFNNGSLESVIIRKPSEALAAAKLPLAVVDAVVTSALAAPGQFVSNFSGLPPAQQMELIKQANSNAKEVASLRAELDKIHAGDFLGEGPLKRIAHFTDASNPFRLKCSNDVVAVK